MFTLAYYLLILATLGFMLLDIITGVIFSKVRGDYDSSKMRKGGGRKIVLIGALVLGVALDLMQIVLNMVIQSYPVLSQMIPFEIGIPFGIFFSLYILYMEISSIEENIKITYPGALPSYIEDKLAKAAESTIFKNNKKE